MKDTTQTLTRRPSSAARLVTASFSIAVILAMVSFMGAAIYLSVYLMHAFAMFGTKEIAQFSNMDSTRLQDILLARASLWKFLLQSCSVVSGIAFGFLGFALFLLGVKGDMDATYSDPAHKVQITRMAPGSLVIVAAAALIGITSTNRVTLSLSQFSNAATQFGTATSVRPGNGKSVDSNATGGGRTEDAGNGGSGGTVPPFPVFSWSGGTESYRIHPDTWSGWPEDLSVFGGSKPSRVFAPNKALKPGPKPKLETGVPKK